MVENNIFQKNVQALDLLRQFREPDARGYFSEIGTAGCRLSGTV